MAEYKNVKDKLSAELKSAKLSPKGKAVSKAVISALEDFCHQNSEFEQAVMQGGKVGDCIESTVKGSGNSISDLEVYKKAVQFYFPGAKVHMSLTLDLGDDGFSNKPEDKPITVSTNNKVELSLDDLLDF